jgi:hypothetical protein
MDIADHVNASGLGMIREFGEILEHNDVFPAITIRGWGLLNGSESIKRTVITH